ncbi:MAG TPA: hypothetical protein VGN26_12600 [Armatimonadota bacterium]|jgi:hypothetical protein
MVTDEAPTGLTTCRVCGKTVDPDDYSDAKRVALYPDREPEPFIWLCPGCFRDPAIRKYAREQAVELHEAELRRHEREKEANRQAALVGTRVRQAGRAATTRRGGLL